MPHHQVEVAGRCAAVPCPPWPASRMRWPSVTPGGIVDLVAARAVGAGQRDRAAARRGRPPRRSASSSASWSAPGIGPHDRGADRPPNRSPNRSSMSTSWSPNRRRGPRPLAAAGAAAAAGPAPAAAAGLRPCPGLRVDVLGHLAEVVAEGVVAAARLRVGQHVVRLVDLLEPLLGAGVLVDVGVVGAGQLAVGLLDLVGRRVAARPRGPRRSRGARPSARDPAPRRPPAGRRTAARRVP